MATTPSMHVCMESSDWLKGIVNSDGIMDISNSSSPSPDLLSYTKQPHPILERRLRPPHDHPLKCPRCDSSHTKFCYYNNYSLSQPRYFCKTCRRYWTKGGSLRNVPVGGGCRKNKRSTASKKTVTDQAQIFDNIHQQLPVDLQLSNLSYFNYDIASTDHGFNFNSLGFLNFEGQEEVKPENRMLSLEWSEQGCSDLYGYANGIGIWHGHGSSSSAAM